MVFFLTSEFLIWWINYFFLPSFRKTDKKINYFFKKKHQWLHNFVPSLVLASTRSYYQCHDFQCQFNIIHLELSSCIHTLVFIKFILIVITVNKKWQRKINNIRLTLTNICYLGIYQPRMVILNELAALAFSLCTWKVKITLCRENPKVNITCHVARVISAC